MPWAVSSHLTVFTTRPRLTPPAAIRRGRPRTRATMVTPVPAIAVRDWAAQLPGDWRRITWRNGAQPTRTARFAAVRVTPAHDWRHAQSREAARMGFDSVASSTD